jgi:replicative DNA helicase
MEMANGKGNGAPQADPFLETSRAAERSLLACCLHDPRAALLVAERMRSGWILDGQHRAWWDAILALTKRGAEVDPVTIDAEVTSMARPGIMGRGDELARLIESERGWSGPEPYVEIIRTTSARRRLRYGAARAQLVIEAGDPLHVAVQALQDAIEEAELAGPLTSSADSATLSREYLQRLEQVLHTRRPPGIATGLGGFDRLTGGLQPAQLYVIASKPGVGKTTLGTQMAVLSAAAGAPSLLVSIEMTKEEIWERVCCGAAGVSSIRARCGHLTELEAHEVRRASEDLARLPFAIHEDTRASLLGVRLSVRAAVERGVRLVVVDYLQRMHDPGHDAEWQMLSAISHGLKTMAMELRIPIVVLSQRNRSDEDGLESLKGSGGIEEAADVVGILTRKANGVDGAGSEDAVPSKLALYKNRHGPRGTIDLVYIPKRASFQEVDRG